MIRVCDYFIARLSREELSPSHQSSSTLSYQFKQPSKADTISIVAIHGLGAKPDFTWCHWTSGSREQSAGNELVNWLQDDRMLPSAVPNARIMRYGYESEWFGKGALQTRLMDIVPPLLKNLCKYREVSKSTVADIYIQ